MSDCAGWTHCNSASRKHQPNKCSAIHLPKALMLILDLKFHEPTDGSLKQQCTYDRCYRNEPHDSRVTLHGGGVL